MIPLENVKKQNPTIALCQQLIITHLKISLLSAINNLVGGLFVISEMTWANSFNI